MIEIPILQTLTHPFNQVLDRPDNEILQKINPKEGQSGKSLSEIIQGMGVLPSLTAVLGTALDGLPLLLELKNPRPGALLITGDPLSGKTALLKSIFTSLVTNGLPSEVQFSLISAKPAQWQKEIIAYRPFIRGHASNYELQAVELIYDLCNLVESRQSGELPGGAQLLLFDGLETLPYMDQAVVENFLWLLEYGPKQSVWPIATLNRAAALAHERLRCAFHTHLIGAIHNLEDGWRIAASNRLNTTQLQDGHEFAVRMGGGWLKFTLPNQLN